MRTSRRTLAARSSRGRTVVGAVLAVATALSASIPALAQDATGGTYVFRFVSVDSQVDADGEPIGTDQIFMNGTGTVTVEADPMAGTVTEGDVEAGGTFTHYDSDEALPLPKPVLAHGYWEADNLVSFETIGTFGAVIAGVVVMDVTLFPEDGEPIQGQLTMNCNSPPGDQFTGLLEGYYLEIGDMSFAPSGPPPAGLTIITSR